MRVLDRLLGRHGGASDEATTAAPVQPTLHHRSVSQIVDRYIDDRQSASISMTDALRIPAIARGVDILTSVGSSFDLVEYADGAPAHYQQVYVRQPDPYQPRKEWLASVIWSLVTDGNAYLRRGSTDSRGYPSFAIPLDPSSVSVEWDQRELVRRYTWRDQTGLGPESILHIAIGRKPGALTGTSALKQSLPALAAIAASEAYALSAFVSGGVPQVVLRAATERLTAAEASALKESWTEQRAETPGAPAVTSAGIEISELGRGPADMQLLDTRAANTTTCARVLGIPAPLLLVNQSGSDITYANAEQLTDACVKQTILPLYLGPIEAAMGSTIPRSRQLRFSMAELMRSDVTTRFSVYEKAIASGIITAEEARRFEGLPASPEDDAPVEPQYIPPPTMAYEASDIPASEVPNVA